MQRQDPNLCQSGFRTQHIYVDLPQGPGSTPFTKPGQWRQRGPGYTSDQEVKPPVPGIPSVLPHHSARDRDTRRSGGIAFGDLPLQRSNFIPTNTPTATTTSTHGIPDTQPLGHIYNHRPARECLASQASPAPAKDPLKVLALQSNQSIIRDIHRDTRGNSIQKGHQRVQKDRRTSGDMVRAGCAREMQETLVSTL